MLEKIACSLQKKHGTKKTAKVYERIGRAKERFPSVHHCYHIEVKVDEQTDTVTAITWH
jgi:hypothetical protein